MSAILGGLLAAFVMIGMIVIVQSFRPGPDPASRQKRVGQLSAKAGDLLKWSLAQVLVTGFIWFLSGWPAVGLGIGTLVWVARLWFIASRERNNFHLLTEAISVWVDMVKDSLGGGAGLSQAIESTTAVAPEVIRPTVARLASRQRTGSQTEALREFGATLAHPTSDLVVLALVSASENQARDLPKLLAKTAEQARARNEAVSQIETERSKLYAEARAMILAIAVLSVIITVVAKDFLEPYSRPTGQVVLAVVMFLVVGSAALLVHSGRPQPEPRLLAPEGANR